jgi:pSer/pThr/pTyr-binding forkhead associated (FHA) protein
MNEERTSVKFPGRSHAPPADPLAPGALVVIADGNSTTYTVEPGQNVVLGRDATSNIILDDASVSPRHALIARLGPGWLVSSLDVDSPARILDATGRAHPIVKQLGLRSGELLIGGYQVRLYPPPARKQQSATDPVAAPTA